MLILNSHSISACLEFLRLLFEVSTLKLDLIKDERKYPEGGSERGRNLRTLTERQRRALFASCCLFSLLLSLSLYLSSTFSLPPANIALDAYIWIRTYKHADRRTHFGLMLDSNYFFILFRIIFHISEYFVWPFPGNIPYHFIQSLFARIYKSAHSKYPQIIIFPYKIFWLTTKISSFKLRAAS